MFDFLRVRGRRVLSLLLLMAIAHAGSAGAAEAIDFAKTTPFTALKLSPDGQYFAALYSNEDNNAVIIFRAADAKMVGHFRLPEDNHVFRYFWISDKRIVAELAHRDGPFDTLGRTGELVAFNYDGSDYTYLFGYRGEVDHLGSRLYKNKQDIGYASVVDPLIDDPKHLLISVKSFLKDSDNDAAVVYELDARNGRKTRVDTAPDIGNASFVFDADGKPRYVAISDATLAAPRVFSKARGEKEWTRYAAPATNPNAHIQPLEISRDGRFVYLLSNEFGPTYCLVRHELATDERKKLACNDTANITDVVYAFDGSRMPIAAASEPGKAELTILDPARDDAKLVKVLQSAFPGRLALPVSTTRDGKTLLVYVYSDRNPGDYYLFDTQKRSASFVLGLYDWIDPDQLGERRPIELKARDGLTLHGYLTIPKGAKLSKLPLVVMPHGGPYQVRDGWAFDAEPQLLANQGYAVLQINFRGSGGYGDAFLAAGNKGWATKMIDDITDAVRWSIDQNYVDANRICIYGASYGGYAAVMSAVREPDLYRCVVTFAGIYDLRRFKQGTDFTSLSSGRAYFEQSIGESDDVLKAWSPLTYLDNLKAPVFIVHGENDRRVPFDQAEALRAALKARGARLEWMSKPGEGHGFFRMANVQEFQSRLVAFLNANIGAAAAKPETGGQ